MEIQIHNTSADLADGQLVQKFLRSRAGDGSRVGPFSILFATGNRGLFANYAIPDDDTELTVAQIAALEETFRARKRRPRLEYVPVAAPAVERALTAAGFVVEMRPPLMTRRAGNDVTTPWLAGFEMVFVDTPADLEEAVRVETEAFGGDEAEAKWLKTNVARGGRVLVAYCRQTGEAAKDNERPARARARKIVGAREIMGAIPKARGQAKQARLVPREVKIP